MAKFTYRQLLGSNKKSAFENDTFCAILGPNNPPFPSTPSFLREKDDDGDCFGVLDIQESHVQYYLVEAAKPQAVPCVQDFHFIPNCTEKPKKTGEFYDVCIKSGLKNRKSLRKVLEFFRGQTHDTSSMGIEVGPAAFVERMEIPSREIKSVTQKIERPTVNMNHFAKAKFSFQDPFSGFPILDTQFFTTRSSNLRAKDKISDIGKVHIVSGVCLFSQQHLPYEHRKGVFDQHCPPLPEDRRPTMYEIESVIRLSNSIADVVLLLPSEVEILVTLDIPRVQYYASVVEIFESGHCSKEHVRAWLSLFDKRHNQLAATFSQALGSACSRRGSPRPNLRIEISSGLDEAIPYIHNQIAKNEKLSIEDLLQGLFVYDPDFSEYHACSSESQASPTDLTALSKASYSYQLVRPLLQQKRELENPPISDETNTSQKRKLLLHIDNQAEWRIYSKAENFLKNFIQKAATSGIELQNPLLIGLYPLERIFTAANTGRTSLYLRDGGQEFFERNSGSTLTPIGILSKVYGKDLTGPVLRLMWEANMFDQDAYSVSSTPSLVSDSEAEDSDWSEDGNSTSMQKYGIIPELGTD